MPDTNAAIEAIRAKYGSRLCIMAHHYECDDIVSHADFIGDSLELARRIPGIDAEWIVFCGVSFMGETAAVLAKPGQKVIMPEPAADCKMALMSQADDVARVIAQLRDRGISCLPLAYVNTDAALKAVVGANGGAVCTSANAKTMLEWAYSQADRVLFLPDMHLGRNTALKLGMTEADWHILRLDAAGIAAPETQPLTRRLLLWPGYCPIHAAITPDMIRDMRTTYPGCRVTIHPEAAPEVTSLCDGAGSTSFLIKDAQAAADKDTGDVLVVGTEVNLVERLAARHKGHCTIVPLMSKEAGTCPDMAAVTPEKVLKSLETLETAQPASVPDAVRAGAKLALERMLEACR